MKLSTEVKKYVVLTFAGGKYFITQQEFDKILATPNNSSVIIQKTPVKISNIAEIPPIEEYFNQHPNERPEFYPDTQLYLKNYVSGMSDQRRKIAISKVIEGFKQYFQGREIPITAQNLLNGMIRKWNG